MKGWPTSPTSAYNAMSIGLAAAVAGMVWWAAHDVAPRPRPDSPSRSTVAYAWPPPTTQISVAGAKKIGDPSANVWALVFLDFEAASGGFVNDTLPNAAQPLIDQESLSIFIRHAKRGEATIGLELAAAAECGARIDRHVPFLRALFELPTLEGRARVNTAWARVTDNAGLEDCLLGPGLAGAGRDATETARLGVISFPTVFFGRRGHGVEFSAVRVLSGLVTKEDLRREVQRLSTDGA